VTRILYLPLATDNTNRYSDNMMEALSHFGPVSGFTVARGLKHALKGNVERADLILLNWLENEIVSKEGSLSSAGFAKCLLKILLSKIFARKVVYVRHNRYPHCTDIGHRVNVMRAVDFLEARCHASVVHSMMAVTERRLYVPHPLYKVEARTPLIEHNGEYFVCFGRIMRYKNFEALVRCFPANRRLIIAGACGDAPYVAELRALASDNVDVRGGYIDEAEAQRLVGESAGVIICHAEHDVIVSGTFFYALSLGVKIYALKTDFSAWAKRELGERHVEIYEDIVQLTRALPATADAGSSSEIDPRVRRLFGDQAVRQALSAVLARVGLP
jgi:hypothetical protein